MPLIRVWAVNEMNALDPVFHGAPMHFAFKRFAIQVRRCFSLRASTSAIDANAASRPTRQRRIRPWNQCVACRLPTVMVPVLSSSTVSMSPAISTAFAAFGQDVGLQGAVHAGDADRGQQGSDRRGDQTDQQCHQRRHVGPEAL